MSSCQLYISCSCLTLSRVCIGTGRGISSKNTVCSLRSLSPLNFSTLEDARRTRMLLANMVFDLTETGLRLEIPEDHGKFETFCDESADILWRFDGIQRVITPVHGNCDHYLLLPKLTSSQWWRTLKCSMPTCLSSISTSVDWHS